MSLSGQSLQRFVRARPSVVPSFERWSGHDADPPSVGGAPADPGHTLVRLRPTAAEAIDDYAEHVRTTLRRVQDVAAPTHSSARAVSLRVLMECNFERMRATGP